MGKKNSFIVVALLLTIGLLSYFLYEDSNNAINETQKDIKLTNTIILDNPNKSLNKATLNQNLRDLKKVLSKTQAMLKSHNINNPNVIISNLQIDKLVNLDLKDIKKEKKIINYESKENINIEDKETINNINEEKINNIEISKTNQSSQQVTTTTNSSSSTINDTPVNKDTKQNVDENTQIITDKNVQTEVTKLKTQIADVKKIIEKISSNIQ